jgi:hypothetical protein
LEEGNQVELISLYLDRLPKGYRSEGVYSVWDDFINSDERYISVIAGRRTGKTTALIKRAILKNDRDQFFVQPNFHWMTTKTRLLINTAEELGFEAEILVGNSSRIEIYVNQHKVYFVPIQWLYGLESSAYENKEVIFEEPEAYNTQMDSHFIDFLIEKDCRIVMTGSMIYGFQTMFDRFHEYAKKNGWSKIIPSTAILGQTDLEEIAYSMSASQFYREFHCIRDIELSA